MFLMRLLLIVRFQVPRLSDVRWRFLLVVVLAAGGLVAPVFAAQATADPNEQRINELRDALGHASAEEAEVLAELAEVRAEREALDGAVRAIEAEMATANAAADAARAERDAAAAQYLVLVEKVAATEAELVETKERFDLAAASMYRATGGGATGPALLFELSPEEYQNAQRYLTDATRGHYEDAQYHIALKAQLEDEQAEVVDQKAIADELTAVAEAEEARVASLLEDQQVARDAVKAVEDREEALLADIRARKDEFADEIRRLEEESARLRDQYADQGEQGTAPTALMRPVNAPITSGFGPRVHPITGAVRMHNGIDFGASQGTPIAAAEAGTVAVAGWSTGGFGNYVIISHGGGLQTLYAHQSSLAVSAGQSVSRGQTIGYVGSTGMSTGPHLHWEVWQSGTPVNPMNYI